VTRLSAGRGRYRWVQATKVRCEDLLLCEAATYEYRPRWDGLGPDGDAQLGWQAVPGADATLWAAADTAAAREQLTELLAATLVAAFAHPSDDTPTVVTSP